MQKVAVTAAHLKAIALLAAQQDVRFYLNGVLVEATPFETRLVATDGHKLGVVRFATENEITSDLSFIVPTSAIDSLKVGKREMSAPLSIEIDGADYAIVASGVRISFKPVDGKFPHWQRVVPKTLSGKAAQYDLTLLMDFVKCGRILLGSSTFRNPRIEQNGERDAARLTFDNFDDFIGVLMPFVFKTGPKASKPADVSWFQGA